MDDFACNEMVKDLCAVQGKVFVYIDTFFSGVFVLETAADERIFQSHFPRGAGKTQTNLQTIGHTTKRLRFI